MKVTDFKVVAKVNGEEVKLRDGDILDLYNECICVNGTYIDVDDLENARVIIECIDYNYNIGAYDYIKKYLGTRVINTLEKKHLLHIACQQFMETSFCYEEDPNVTKDDLACFLGFKDWKELLKFDVEKLFD